MGFWVSGQHRAEVWGRPAALAVTKDGSLLIADDTGGTIGECRTPGQRAGHLIGNPRQGPHSGEEIRSPWRSKRQAAVRG